MLLLVQSFLLPILLFVNSFGMSAVKHDALHSFKDIRSYKDLKSKRAFSFSIISDLHGETPLTNRNVAKTTKWITEDESKFVLGLGDVDVTCAENCVMSFIVRSDWWSRNYFPTIGDTEDQYFIDDPQDETYKSAQLYLKVLGIHDRENVEVSPDGKEYYAIINYEGINIHFISLYYTDVIHGNRDLFPPESKEFLINTLNKIDKQANDIIIVGAHTEFGSFIYELDDADKNLVMNKCDLLLSGGVHFFLSNSVEGYVEKGAINISCGSPSKARWGAPNGFVQIHVFKNPLSMVIQYLDLSKEELQLVDTPYSYIKVVNGLVHPVSFQNL